MTDHARAIEAGARAALRIIDERPFEEDYPVGSIGAFNAQGRREKAEAKARAVIEAAIASGELVPASAVAAERERCAAIIDSYAQPDRFKPSEQWKEDMTVAEVYETGVIDAMGWAAKEVRALSPEPASGEFVVVPRVPTAHMVRCGEDGGRKAIGVALSQEDGRKFADAAYRAMLNAATKDGER